MAQNTLAIQRVSKSDEGLYELTVTDSNGSSRKGVYVYVIDAVVTTKRPGISYRLIRILKQGIKENFHF